MMIPVLKHCQVLSFFKPIQVFRGFTLYRNPDDTCAYINMCYCYGGDLLMADPVIGWLEIEESEN